MSSDEGKLYVGGLSFDTTEQALEDMFSKYGQISEVVVIKDRETQTSRGFGFVTFESAGDAKEAIEALDGKFVDGRNIRVDQAGKPKVGGFGGGGGYQRGSGPRGGNFRGGRRGSDGRGSRGQERNYYSRSSGGYQDRSGGEFGGGW